MNVLVTGGTGFVGRHLCRELDDRGHTVTALSRTPDDEVLPESVATATGDVTAYDSIEPAFEGQDAVVNLVALSTLYAPPSGLTHEGVHVGGTRNVVAAAEKHGLDKIVQMSALGADPNGSTAYIRAKGEAENVVRNSSLGWTIFRPSVIFGEDAEFVSFTKLLTTPYVTALPGGGQTRFQPIWIGDLAPMLADSLDAERDGEVYEVGGPEVLTLADVARIAYQAEGKSLYVVPVPMVFAKVALILAEFVPFFPFGRDQYRSLLFDNTVTENNVEEFGVELARLTTLEEYLTDTT